MSLIDSSDPRPVHFMGIAGAGMRALAELLARRGTRVTGCDAAPGDTEDLRALGIEVLTGHDATHTFGARAIVVTSAVPRTHPELEAARNAGIPVLRRAEALGEAVSGGELVAVAGTHGKSTTTVMTAFALDAAGRKPTTLVGARIAAWNGNFQAGRTDLYVVEADEYDRSFLALAPTVAVITNIESDHLDIYRDLDDIRDTFAKFASGARAIVISGDDPVSAHLPVPKRADVLRFGFDPTTARLTATEIALGKTGSRFNVRFDTHRMGAVRLNVPGEHNVRNALAALGAGMAEGHTVEEMSPGLAEFHGVERRFQLLDVADSVTVIDDYAHHPTEIAATILAARDAYPNTRIIVAFQPHLYSRTRDFAPQFAAELAKADVLFLVDLYPAREQPIAGVSSAMIGDLMRQAGRARPVWEGPLSDLVPALSRAARPGDVVITMGAGDITHAGPELLAALRARSGE